MEAGDFVPLVGETPEQTAARQEAERQTAEDGTAVDDLFSKPVFKKAIVDLGKDYYQEFLKAKTDDERRDAQAKGNALLGLAKELRSVSERGRMAKHARKTRAAAKEAAERRKRGKALDESRQEN